MEAVYELQRVSIEVERRRKLEEKGIRNEETGRGVINVAVIKVERVNWEEEISVVEAAAKTKLAAEDAQRKRVQE